MGSSYRSISVLAWQGLPWWLPGSASWGWWCGSAGSLLHLDACTLHSQQLPHQHRLPLHQLPQHLPGLVQLCSAAALQCI